MRIKLMTASFPCSKLLKVFINFYKFLLNALKFKENSLFCNITVNLTSNFLLVYDLAPG